MKPSIAAAKTAQAAQEVSNAQGRIERKLDALLLKLGFGLDENGEVIVPETGTITGSQLPHFAELAEESEAVTITPDDEDAPKKKGK